MQAGATKRKPQHNHTQPAWVRNEETGRLKRQNKTTEAEATGGEAPVNPAQLAVTLQHGASRNGYGWCTICRSEEENVLLVLSCDHAFCFDCLKGYIQNAFGSGNANFDRLKCIDCQQVITRDEIAHLVDENEAILAFYDERAHKRANSPVVNVHSPDDDEQAEIAAGNLQICPGCNRRTHRIDGCNHMTCSPDEGGCGIEYCYVCGTRYNQLINGGRGWEARACTCPHFPNGNRQPIPLPGGHLEQDQALLIGGFVGLYIFFTVCGILTYK